MTRTVGTWLGATTFAVLLAVFVTWPQALHVDTALVSHHDPYFSVWRLAWIAHALVTSPWHLFDTNIFYPATGTLAYSDATLLEGLLGAPLFWAHVSPVLIYNLLLLAGLVGSAIAMFVLVRHLTGAAGPALVSAAAFTLGQYRVEHMMHLELQWAMWIPLTFWALHRAIDGPSPRFGVLAGLFVWLQIVSCVYYGLFLVMILAATVPVLILISGPRVLRALPGLALGALLAAVLTLPYAWPYVRAAQTLGARDVTEIARYSARPINYLASTSLSWLWGWTADRWGGPELRLFPGAIAIVVAAFSIRHRSWRHVVLYALVAATAVELSFGSNGVVFPWLSRHVSSLEGFRSTSRFAIFALCGIAVLAGLGTQALAGRLAAGTGGRVMLVSIVLCLMVADYANRPMPLTEEALGVVSPVYKVIRSAAPGVVVELPMAPPDRLPGWDPYYDAWSITHWRPLVNGYSGHHPLDYLQTLERMRTFPDDASIARLRAHDVRYVVVHRAFFEPERYTSLMLRMAVRPELRPWGTYKDPVGNAELFVLER